MLALSRQQRVLSAGITGQDTAEQKRAKLAHALGDDSIADDDLALVAELLSIPPHTPIAMSPQQKRDHLMRILLEQVGATHLLTKTLPKVAAEMALAVLAYNLTRVMNIVGTKRLMLALAS